MIIMIMIIELMTIMTMIIILILVMILMITMILRMIITITYTTISLNIVVHLFIGIAAPLVLTVHRVHEW